MAIASRLVTVIRLASRPKGYAYFCLVTLNLMFNVPKPYAFDLILDQNSVKVFFIKKVYM